MHDAASHKACSKGMSGKPEGRPVWLLHRAEAAVLLGLTRPAQTVHILSASLALQAARCSMLVL